MPGYTRNELEPVVSAAGLDVRSVEAGDHAIEFLSIPAGDYEGLLAGLADGCEAIHCGYIVKGRMRFRYADGRVEEFETGHAFYVGPGHHFEVMEDVELVGFTVADEDYRRMQEAIQRNMPRVLEQLASRS